MDWAAFLHFTFKCFEKLLKLHSELKITHGLTGSFYLLSLNSSGVSWLWMACLNLSLCCNFACWPLTLGDNMSHQILWIRLRALNIISGSGLPGAPLLGWLQVSGLGLMPNASW